MAAGRPKGASNKRTSQKHRDVERMLRERQSPLEIMCRMMWGDDEYDSNRFEVAKAAAPYVHPKLAATELNAKLDVVSHEDALSELDE